MLTDLISSVWPELVLVVTACALFLLSALTPAASRRVAPVMALSALLIVFGIQLALFNNAGTNDLGFTGSVFGGPISSFIRLLICPAGALFVLLGWPTDRGQGLGNGALALGNEVGEYYALMMLSLAGVFLTADANNLIVLFLGLELASIPTYIMVSISRPLAQSQEAGVKYFFLGAMSAAVMLLGFSYLYGVTGSIMLYTGTAEGISGTMRAQLASATPGMSSLQELGLILLLIGFAFKMAAFPLHVYAADVYQGAASSLTALLSVVPKTTGLVATIKVLAAVGGPNFEVSNRILMLIAVIAALTMTVGNVLALLPFNIKRTMAYSSVAQSGYLLAGVAAVVAIGRGTDHRASHDLQIVALGGVLVYLAIYAVMNTGVFAVLQQLPARRRFGEDATQAQLIERGSATAETYEDIAGYGKHHPVLALCMAVCCLSLVGVPATAGFLGKVMLAKPLLDSSLKWLLVVMFVNAAISAGYYLRLPATLFFRPLPEGMNERSPFRSVPGSIAAVGCAVAVLAFGLVLPLSSKLAGYAAVAGGYVDTTPVYDKNDNSPMLMSPTGGGPRKAPKADDAESK